MYSGVSGHLSTPISFKLKIAEAVFLQAEYSSQRPTLLDERQQNLVKHVS